MYHMCTTRYNHSIIDAAAVVVDGDRAIPSAVRAPKVVVTEPFHLHCLDRRKYVDSIPNN